MTRRQELFAGFMCVAASIALIGTALYFALRSAGR
jgi:hypothetical protein